MGFFTPQYHLAYDDKFIFIPNAASDGLFYDNTFNASSWYKLVCSGLEDHTNKEYFDLSDQYHPMHELNVDWVTPDEGCCLLPSSPSSEGERPSSKHKSIPSYGDISHIPSAPGSNYINQTKDNISFSDHKDKK